MIVSNDDWNSDNMVIKRLQAIRASQSLLGTGLSQTESDIQYIKLCLGTLEKGLSEGFFPIPASYWKSTGSISGWPCK